jgi:hypothetical protein
LRVEEIDASAARSQSAIGLSGFPVELRSLEMHPRQRTDSLEMAQFLVAGYPSTDPCDQYLPN